MHLWRELSLGLDLMAGLFVSGCMLNDKRYIVYVE